MEKSKFIVRAQTRYSKEAEALLETGKYEVVQRVSSYSYEIVHICDSYKEGNRWVKENIPSKIVYMKSVYAVCLTLPFATLFYHKSLAETAGFLWDDIPVSIKVIVGIVGLVSAFLSGWFMSEDA